MTISRRQTFRIGAGAALAGVAMPHVVRAQGKMKLDLSTVWPDGNFHTKNCRLFAEQVGKVTGGAVEIVVHSGGSLGYKGPEHLNAVRDGLVPMADVLNIQQVGEAPLLGIEGVPFLVGSPAELKVLQKFARPEFDKIATKYNQTILYTVPWPTQYLHCKVKADKLDGLKGLKIRVPDRQAGDMVNALGMVGVQIPWGETVPALASGAVVGVTTSSVSGVDGKFWEFLKYFYRTNHVWSSQIVTINNDNWKKISADHQKAIRDLAAKLEPEFWNVSVEADASSSKRLIEGGMELIEVPPAMFKEMREKTIGLEQAFVGRAGAVAADIIAQYKKELGRA
ncbi:MAG TPA: TRAP transporter substrate-binding protein [Vineibacter sp.]|nr:TRAP transporter substrate-binding protein [Vineibacter sp.]